MVRKQQWHINQMAYSIFLSAPPTMKGIFFAMSSRTLSESGIFAPVEGVGVAFHPRNDGRNHYLSKSLYSIQKRGGGSEFLFIDLRAWNLTSE